MWCRAFVELPQTCGGCVSVDWEMEHSYDDITYHGKILVTHAIHKEMWNDMYIYIYKLFMNYIYYLYIYICIIWWSLHVIQSWTVKFVFATLHTCCVQCGFVSALFSSTGPSSFMIPGPMNDKQVTIINNCINTKWGREAIYIKIRTSKARISKYAPPFQVVSDYLRHPKPLQKKSWRTVS